MSERRVFDDRATATAVAGFVVALVLVFDPFGWAVFGPSKHLVVSAGAFAVAAMASRRGFAVHRRSAVAWIAFLTWAAVVGLWAADRLGHWIGTPDRRVGWITWLIFGLLFVVGQQIGARGRLMFGRAAAVGLIGVGLFTVAEAAGRTPVDLGDRLGGPFGNAAYLGAAVVLLLPVVVSVAMVDRRWRVAASAGAAGGVLALALSQSRAAWVAVVVIGALTVRRLDSTVRTRLTVGSVVAMLVVAGVSGVGERFVSVFDADDPGGAGRIDEWRVAAGAQAAHPAGVGFEGYRIVFPDHVDDAYVKQHGRAVVTDRAHNVILDVGIPMGVPGVVAAMVALVWVWRIGRSAARDLDPILAGLGLGILGYATHQVFLFPLAEIDPLFWLMVGQVVAAGGDTPPVDVVGSGRMKWSVVAATVAALLLPFGVRDVLADRSIGAALASSEVSSSSPAAAAERAVGMRSDSFRYWMIAAQVVSSQGDFDRAAELIDSALERSAGDPGVVRISALLADERVLAEGGSSSGLTAARAAWERAITVDPVHAGNQLAYGRAALLSGDAATAEAAWLRAEVLAPDSPVPATNLARLYERVGRSDDAAEATRRAAAIAAAAEDPP